MSPAQEVPILIAADHPAFAGHFPGFPVVPGALLLDEALRIIAATAGIVPERVAWAKFLRPVRPGEALLLRYATEPGGAIRFEITSDARTAATGCVSVHRGT
jgi:3-hydroxymyristoyl/3-hydroxydecanoyl-(acyl carrier protein) dehydratase